MDKTFIDLGEGKIGEVVWNGGMKKSLLQDRLTNEDPFWLNEPSPSKRRYNKRSAYWKKFEAGNLVDITDNTPLSSEGLREIEMVDRTQELMKVLIEEIQGLKATVEELKEQQVELVEKVHDLTLNSGGFDQFNTPLYDPVGPSYGDSNDE